MLEQAVPVATGGAEGQEHEDLEELVELDAKVHDAEALGAAPLCNWSRGQFPVVPGTRELGEIVELDVHVDVEVLGATVGWELTLLVAWSSTPGRATPGRCQRRWS